MKRELADLDLRPRVGRVLFGQADLRELGVRVDDARAGGVVHVPAPAGHRLDGGDAFLLGLVGEHEPADHVADRVDAGDVGLEVFGRP